MPLDMYAGIYVRDYEVAKSWYAQLLGSEPSFIASETEAVWELTEHRSIAIEVNADHAGHAILAIFVDDLEAPVTQIAERGIRPTERLTYRNGVRKAPGGNEVAFGGAPVQTG
jgi:hypothetical protein